MIGKSGSGNGELAQMAPGAGSRGNRRQRCLSQGHGLRTDMARLVIIPIVSLLFCSGCVHWVSIDSDIGSGQTRKYDKVRVNGDEHKEVEDAYISWPVLAAIKDGKPLTTDLRHSSVEREATDSKRTAAVVVGSILGGSAAVAGLSGLLYLLFRNLSFGYPGGCC